MELVEGGGSTKADVARDIKIGGEGSTSNVEFIKRGGGTEANVASGTNVESLSIGIDANEIKSKGRGTNSGVLSQSATKAKNIIGTNSG